MWCADPGLGDVRDATPRPCPPAHLFQVSSPHVDDLGIEVESWSVAPEKRNEAGLSSELLRKRCSQSSSAPALRSGSEQQGPQGPEAAPSSPVTEASASACKWLPPIQTVFASGIQLSGENSCWQVLQATTRACCEISENHVSPR